MSAPRSDHNRQLHALHGFTLIELLVVVSIIALLIALILPALSGARDQARAIACLNQQRQIGFALHTYAGEQKEWLLGAWLAHLGGYQRYWEGRLHDSGVWDATTRRAMLSCPAETPAYMRNIGISGETAAGRQSPQSYIYNQRAGCTQTNGQPLSASYRDRKLANILRASSAPLLFDADNALRPQPSGAYLDFPGNTGLSQLRLWTPTDSSARHKTGFNILFADSHAQFVRPGSGISALNERLDTMN